MGVVLEVRVFPLIAAAAPMTVGCIPTAGMAPDDQRQEWGRLIDGKIRPATVADGFVRLPPNVGDLGNVPRAG